MNKRLLNFIFLGVILVAPFIVLAGVEDPPVVDDAVVTTIKNITDFITNVAYALAMLFYVYAGFTYVSSSGDTTKIKTAKDIILYTTIGLIIVLMAGAIYSIVSGFAVTS